MFDQERIREWLKQAGIQENMDIAVLLLELSAAILASYVVYLFSRLVIIRLISRALESNERWYKGLVETGLFKSIANLFPVMLLNVVVPHIFVDSYESWLGPVQTGLNIYLVWTIVGIVLALSNVVATLYQYSAQAREVPITGAVQVFKLVAVLIGIIITASVVLGKSPMYLLSGIGALTAVLVLVFRDTLMGFVAGIQLASNRMVGIGDWIEMPSHKVDGTVQEVGLISVKVENWDKTIVFLPTYALIHQSFKNWQGMVNNGGRRMKRSIPLDTNSITTLDDEELESALQGSSKGNLSEWLAEHEVKTPLSNLTAFRLYTKAYLKDHAKVKQDFTLMVRLLEPSAAAGLPLEIYAFSKDVEWVIYEENQAGIMEHLYAMLPAFKLRAFQYLSPPPQQQSAETDD